MSLVGWVHAVAAVAYLLTAVLVFWRGGQGSGPRALSLAALTTAAWAGLAAFADASGGAVAEDAARIAEAARSFGWIALLIAVASSFIGRTPALWRYLGVAAVALLAAQAALAAAPNGEIVAAAGYLLAIGLAVIGLMTIENVLRNLSQSQLWALKYLLVALLALFILDFVVHSVVFLFRQENDAFVAARGIVTTALIPLILVSAIRNPVIAVNIHASRGVVFYSATLIASGAYLIVTALVGTYVRTIGGQAATALSLVVVALALIGLVLALLSRTVRSAIKLFISQNFFSYRYDYRMEWSRLTNTIASDNEVVDLHARVVKAAAELLDSHAGSLWLRSADHGGLSYSAGWHFRTGVTVLPESDPVVAALESQPAVLNLADPATLGELTGADALAGWRSAVPDLWLIVPLTHRDRLIGILALSRPRVPRDLGEEDYQLFRLIGGQIAGYIAEEMTYRALMEARQLEEFNKRFAFVIHDIKNLTGQLSLLVRNMEKFGDDPAFRADLSATLRNSVDKMRALLEQLSAKRLAKAEMKAENKAPVRHEDLVRLVRDFTGGWSAGEHRIVVSARADSVPVQLPSTEKLTNVLEQLVQNAIEATPAGGVVTITVSDKGGRGLIEVTDQGPGMDAEFVRNELFRPFRSTKGSGFGIGAYQARETVRQLGGALEVDSAEGHGTTMRIALPLAVAPRVVPA
ncbi:XrtA/PEP-CTERM system histidine kinase PrsK [Desertibaculum subflavum]|uniref:XrtA/PEP-CTERM system histidine kinase PrsK n=1 Tax=Desertibaculum subflavum TaxID=2268458 RepID=UPI000E668AFE